MGAIMIRYCPPKLRRRYLYLTFPNYSRESGPFLKRIRSFVRERFIRYLGLLFRSEGGQFVEADVRSRVAFFEQDVDHLLDRCDVPFA